MISPFYLEELSHMPETMVISAEYCYLLLQGEEFAARLHQQNVPVILHRYNGMNHAFLDKVGVWPQAEQCIRRIGEFILQMSSRDSAPAEGK